MANIRSNAPLDIVINGNNILTIDNAGITVTGTFSSTTPVTSASYAETASFINPLNQNVVINGNTIFSGSLTFAAPTSPAFNGEIVRFGAGTLTTGQLYFLSSSGTWSLANANSSGSSTGMLGIAVGSSPTTNGLLIRGYANSGSFTQATGSILYIATGSGLFTAAAPTSSGHIVRVIGYKTTLSNTIYFMPDNTWVTLA